MEENYGTLSDLGIRFQEAVLTKIDLQGGNPNFLYEDDWNFLYTRLSVDSFDQLVSKAVALCNQNTLRDMLEAI